MRTVTLRTLHRRHVSFRQFRLDVHGPGKRKVWTSNGPRAVIGTHPSADLVIDDKAVSRFHAQIELFDEHVSIRDLGSRNGTRVDGVAIKEAFLKPRSIISIGRSELRFDLAKDEVMVQLSERDEFGSLVGQSPAMRAVFAVLERVAPTTTTVLIEGETGTGKDIAAEAIHRESSRADKPFAVVDCAALPGSLLESELFGHERGAFTGADQARRGMFEIVDGGTILLDEIGDLDLDLQPKLLRVLESQEVRRIGGQPRKIDVRVLAATHRNLRAAVNAGSFRPDLYYRLAVVSVRLPPLRERLDDLTLLVRAIAAELGAPDHPAVTTNDAIAAMRRHDWPGNVRELRNYIEAGITLDAPPRLNTTTEDETTLPLAQARRAFERRYLEVLLRRHGDNVSAAARAAGVDRVFMYRMLRRSGLR